MPQETSKWLEGKLAVLGLVTQSHPTLCDPVDCSLSLFMGFSRQEYWSTLPYPPPGDLPDPGIKPVSLTSPAQAGRFFTTSTIWEDPIHT